MSSSKINKTAMLCALLGSCLLALAAAGSLWWVSTHQQNDPDGVDVVKVKVGANSCEPMNLTLAAGKRFFEIENTSQRAVEWEILSGVMVVAERENILPGFKSRLSANLAPGEYEITCGLLTNPRGKMLVINSDEWKNAVAVQPGNRAFLKPLSEYRVYLILESGRMIKALEELQGAIASSNLNDAKNAWQKARQHYRKLDTFSGRFSDLEARMNPQAQYLANRENDAAFIGFHRIEYSLWAQNSTDNLASIVDDLQAAANDLAQRVRANQVAPSDMVVSAQNVIQKLIDVLTSNHDINVFAKDDIIEMSASIEGIKKSVSLMAEVVQHSAPQLQAEITRNLDGLTRLFKENITNQGVLLADEKQNLVHDLQKLLQNLVQLQEKLGF